MYIFIMYYILIESRKYKSNRTHKNIMNLYLEEVVVFHALIMSCMLTIVEEVDKVSLGVKVSKDKFRDNYRVY